MVFLAEAIEVEEGRANQNDSVELGVLVRNVALIDKESLAAVLIGELLDGLVVLDSVDCLGCLQVEFHAEHWLLFLQGQDQLVNSLEYLHLIHFDQLGSVLVAFDGLWKGRTHSAFDLRR